MQPCLNSACARYLLVFDFSKRSKPSAVGAAWFRTRHKSFFASFFSKKERIFFCLRKKKQKDCYSLCVMDRMP
jgi:hypothetical protein